MKHIPARNKDIVWRNLAGEAVLLNPHNGKYFGLNAVGCSFWEKIDGERTVDEIIDLLLAEYNVDRETLERDINELVSNLEKTRIISSVNLRVPKE